MTADTIGGVWTYAVELSRGLSTHGVKVILATMGAPLQPHQRDDIAKLGDSVELHESNFRLEWMDDPWADVATAGEWLLHLERTRQPEIVHLNGYAHAALDFAAPKMIVAHSCVLSWWSSVKQASAPPAWFHYREQVKQGLRAANLVVAPTRAMLAMLSRLYGDFKDGRVIFNGRDAAPPSNLPPVEHTIVQPALEHVPARASAPCYLSAEKESFVLSVGRLWDEAKNASALAAIAPNLPWPVRLAGDTRRPDGVESMPLPNVELLGHRSAAQISEDYRRAAIYALPARYEPFGLSVLEAALAGCALVLGDIPTLRELWAGAASFIPPNDTNLLRAELENLIHNPYRRQVLGLEAQRRAHRFSVARMTAGYLSAYDELLATARRRPVLATTFA
jgi:glycosyltransferase involved in cell wall biosynthesis